MRPVMITLFSSGSSKLFSCSRTCGGASSVAARKVRNCSIPVRLYSTSWYASSKPTERHSISKSRCTSSNGSLFPFRSSPRKRLIVLCMMLPKLSVALGPSFSDHKYPNKYRCGHFAFFLGERGDRQPLFRARQRHVKKPALFLNVKIALWQRLFHQRGWKF